MNLMKSEVELLEELAFANAGSWQEFHVSLIEMREKRGLTQAQVASKLGISQSAVSQFETTTSTPNLGTVFAYALVVGAKIDFKLADS